MKRIVLFLIVACVAQVVSAQDAGPMASLRRELARTEFDSPSRGARIEIVVTGDAAPAVRMADTGGGRTSVTAYGVRLLSDSSQDGRANARAAMERFESMYPNIGAEMSYEIPAFWVTAGHFVDRLDAVALCGKVQAQFPRAFVVSMEVSVAEIISLERIVPSLPAEVADAAAASDPAE